MDAITALALLAYALFQIYRQSRPGAPMNLLERLLILWAAVCLCRAVAKMIM